MTLLFLRDTKIVREAGVRRDTRYVVPSPLSFLASPFTLHEYEMRATSDQQPATKLWYQALRFLAKMGPSAYAHRYCVFPQTTVCQNNNTLKFPVRRLIG